MGLPATYHEALESEVLRHAREFIDYHRQPGGIFHADAERQYGRVLMKHWALITPFGADDIVYFAEKGSPEADIALREIIAERTNHNEPLGAVLGAYNIRLLNPTRQSRPGPKPAENFVRDAGISLLVAHLIERFNLGGQHNTASKKPTASGSAARALAEARIVALEPKSVEKIFRRFLPVFAGERAAAKTRFAQGIPAGYPALYGPR